MIQIQILSGKMAGVSWTARRFPVRLGRGVENDLQLEEAGVWERHFTIQLGDNNGFNLHAEPGALVTVNQQPATSQALRPGDVLEIGSTQLRFWLAEPNRRSLRSSEFAVWVLFASVLIVEAWVLLGLLG